MFSRFLILNLLLITSCSLFKGSDRLGEDFYRNLDAVKVEGEGKGRLHIRERQYLFNIESVLKENNDWIMAVSIPLHGEEVLILPDLKKKSVYNTATESFALRIGNGIRENIRNSDLTGEDFPNAMRKTLRFLLHRKLSLPAVCEKEENYQVCELEGDKFRVVSDEKTLRIHTVFGHHELVTTASNLTGPIFQRTQFRVMKTEEKQDLLTLELFW